MDAIKIERNATELKYLVNAFLESGTLGCYTCNTCTVECPVNKNVGRLDPRKIVRMAAFGMKEDLLGSVDIWLCMQCKKCSNVCPQKVEPASAIYFFRKVAVEENYVSVEFVRFVSEIEKYIQSLRKHIYDSALNLKKDGKDLNVDELIKEAIERTSDIGDSREECGTGSIAVKQLVIDEFVETRFFRCLTCRECTVSCVVSRAIGSFDPVKIMRTHYLGQQDKILSSSDLWLCISCETCAEVCRQGVKGSALIARLKSQAVEREILPSDITNELAEIDRSVHEIRAELISRTWEKKKEKEFFDLVSRIKEITQG